jgi:hypothetical protein
MNAYFLNSFIYYIQTHPLMDRDKNFSQIEAAKNSRTT